MTERVPNWLRKPSHKKEVIATDKGWVVKETGELLVRVLNLPKRIEEYFGTASPVETKEVLDVETPVENVVESKETSEPETKLEEVLEINKETESVAHSDPAPVKVEKERKRPGPKPKNRS